MKDAQYREDAQARLWTKVDKTDTCWLWTASTEKGYGRFNYTDEPHRNPWPQRAHRLAYSWLVGRIPEGMQLHHKCNVKRCVRPSHLQLVTCDDNVAEMFLRQFYVTRIKKLEEALANLAPEHELLSYSEELEHLF